jgi:hypothetical protein
LFVVVAMDGSNPWAVDQNQSRGQQLTLDLDCYEIDTLVVARISFFGGKVTKRLALRYFYAVPFL